MKKKRIRGSRSAMRSQLQPVRIVEIPRPTDGLRTLGIPACLDRLSQQAFQQALTSIFDPGYSESSYGFRANRSAHRTVLAARATWRAAGGGS